MAYPSDDKPEPEFERGPIDRAFNSDSNWKRMLVLEGFAMVAFAIVALWWWIMDKLGFRRGARW